MGGGTEKRFPTRNHFPQWKLVGGCVVLGASVSMAARSYNTSSWTCQVFFFFFTHPYTHLVFMVERLTALCVQFMFAQV